MQNEKIIDSQTYEDATIEIVQMTHLEGASSPEMANNLFFIAQSRAALRFIRVKLNNKASLKTEAGALYYAKGKIENTLETGGAVGIAGKLVKSALTKETAFNPEYKGIGTVVLEPSFNHYILIKMDNDSFIVDKSCYFCSIGDIDVSPAIQSKVSSAVLGGEGIFQTKISGTGIVALAIPVPMSEVEVIQLNDEMLQVDGNFAILRESTVTMSVGKSSKKVIGTVLSGEGLLNKFKGTGMVWLAPTAPVYNNMKKLAEAGVNPMQNILNGHNNKQ